MDTLISAVPQPWSKQLTPFLMRAKEFEQVKQPITAFYLEQHAAHTAMRLLKAPLSDPAVAVVPKAQATPFVMKLLDDLEGKKSALAEDLQLVDGRTEMSRVALMIFTKADDAERSGAPASEALVKLFYTASLLFECTKQFTDDGEMDAFASEKHRYAQVIAFKMKKALAAGTAYVSPNPPPPAAPQTAGGGGANNGPVYGQDTPSPPPASNGGYPNNNVYQPPPPPPPAAQQQYSRPEPAGPPPPPVQPNFYAPPPPAPLAQSQHQQHPPPTRAPSSSYVPPSAPPGGHNPSMDEMIDAQKYTKLACSALQFYDHVNARQQLLLALQILDGKGGGGK